jgi:hypothetical protein
MRTAARVLSLAFRNWRAAWKFSARSVADVLQIRDSDLARVKPIARHIAQSRKKRDALL